MHSLFKHYLSNRNYFPVLVYKSTQLNSVNREVTKWSHPEVWWLLTELMQKKVFQQKTYFGCNYSSKKLFTYKMYFTQVGLIRKCNSEFWIVWETTFPVAPQSSQSHELQDSVCDNPLHTRWHFCPSYPQNRTMTVLLSNCSRTTTHLLPNTQDNKQFKPGIYIQFSPLSDKTRN